MVQIPEEMEQQLTQLKETLYKTEIWRNYQEARRALLQNPEAYAAMNHFRKENYHFTTHIHGTADIEHGRKEILQEKEKVHGNPLISGYLDAELELCILMRKLLLEIGNAVSLDL